jgi:hypothetical protein
MENIKFKGHGNATSIARNLILTLAKFKWDSWCCFASVLELRMGSSPDCSDRAVAAIFRAARHEPKQSDPGGLAPPLILLLSQQR